MNNGSLGATGGHAIADTNWQTTIAPPAQSRPGGLKGFLINNLPSILGGVGLVGGEILDPFGGGIVSGGAGSALGEALKEKFLGQPISPKQMLIQAGETAALGGAGKVFSAGKNAAKAALGVESAGKAAVPAVDSGVRANLLTQAEQMQARGLGLSSGAKVGPKTLMPQDTASMLQTLKDENIKIGNANSTGRQVVDKLNNYGKQISTHFDTNNAVLGPADKQGIVDRYLQSVEASPNGDATVMKNAQNFADKFNTNVNDTKGIWDFRKALDRNIPESKLMAGSQALTKEQTARIMMRDQLAQELGDVPGMKQYHQLSTIRDFLARGMRDVNAPGGGLIGRIASSGPVQKIESVAGQGLEKVSGGAKTVVPTVENTAPEVLSSNGRLSGVRNGLLGRTVAPIVAKPGSTVKNVATQILGRSLLRPPQQDQNATGGGAGFGGTQPITADQISLDTSSSQTPSQYPKENLLYDIERDPKNSAKYLALYKEMNPSPSATQQANDLAMSIAQSGLKSIAQAYDYAGGGKGAVGIATHIPLVGQYLAPKASAYNQTKIEVATQLAKALTGSSRPAENVIMYYIHSLPNIEDTPEVAQYKLNIMANELKNRGASGAAVFGENATPDPNSALIDALTATGGNQ